VASGSCAIIEPKPGVYRLTASYAPQGSFGGSIAPTAATLTVRRAAARPQLHLSARRIRFGHERRERLSVTVSPQYTGRPSGEVVITANRATLCALRLRHGVASCVLSARRLRPGTYSLRVRYDGSSAFRPATSTSSRLRVTG
jgi:hypothetical protein